MAEHVKHYLTSYLSQNADTWAVSLLRDWEIILGKLAIRMRLEKIQGQTLIIGVYDVHWMHELFLLSRCIIKTINDYLGTAHVEQLKFVMARKKQTKNKKTKTITDISHNYKKTITVQQKSYLENNIHDHELRTLLKKLLQECVSE